MLVGPGVGPVLTAKARLTFCYQDLPSRWKYGPRYKLAQLLVTDELTRSQPYVLVIGVQRC